MDVVETGGTGGNAGALPPNFKFEIRRSFRDETGIFIHAWQIPEEDREGGVMMCVVRTDADGEVEKIRQIRSRIHVTANPDPTMIDGGHNLTDPARTDENKALVIALLDHVFFGLQMDRLADFLDAETFVSHNPRMEADFESFSRFLKDYILVRRAVRYLEICDIVANGNFVAVLSKIEFEGAMYDACDLFRLEGGLIVEHWDVAERQPIAANT